MTETRAPRTSRTPSTPWRNLPECNGKVALLGYCLGALMVFLTAVRCHGVDAAVAYHGGDTEKYLGEVDGLHAPLLMHLAEEDEFISKAAQAEIKRRLLRNQTRQSTAIRVRIMPSLGIMERITTPLLQRSPNERTYAFLPRLAHFQSVLLPE
jgi:hypothetical protein